MNMRLSESQGWRISQRLSHTPAFQLPLSVFSVGGKGGLHYIALEKGK